MKATSYERPGPAWVLLPYRCLLGLLAAWSFVGQAAAEPTYWQDVRPVLRKYCTVCHSTRNLRELDVSGGLALDSYEALRQGSKKPLLVQGKSADSLLVHVVVTKDEDKRMPLRARPLPEEAIAILRRWIDTGAAEGPRPGSPTNAAPVALPARSHKLDVVLHTNAVPPKGILGDARPDKLDLSLAVGPLAPVTAVAFSPDGRLLAAGCYGRLTLWDLDRVEPVRTLTSVLGAVNDARFSPDGKLLAVAGGQPSARGDLRLFQVADGRLVGSLAGHEDVVASVAFSPDSKLLASASFDKTVRLWNVATQKAERVLTGHSDFVYAVAFSPDGRRLASCSKDRSVKVVDAATGKGLLTYSGMNEDVMAVAFSPDGKSVVSSGLEPGVYWWNAQTGERVRVQTGHSVGVHELTFGKDGKLLASAGADRTVRLWNAANGSPQRNIPAGSLVYAVALSPDGKQVVAGCFDGLVRVWDTATGRALLTLLSLPPRGEAADWLAIAPEGFVSGSPGLPDLGRWRMAGQPVADETVWKALRHPDAVVKAMRGERQAAPAFKK